MQLKSKITASLAALIAASFPAVADDYAGNAPKWDLVEVGYVEADFDDDDASPSGFNASFLKSLGENFFLTGRYREVSEDETISGITVDVELSQVSVGAGYKYGVTKNTDVFAQITYENLELKASAQGESGSEDENGFVAAVGVRSMVIDQLELSAQIGYLDIADESETAFSASAYYYFTNNVAIGATYEMWDGVDFMGANLRYAF